MALPDFKTLLSHSTLPCKIEEWLKFHGLIVCHPAGGAMGPGVPLRGFRDDRSGLAAKAGQKTPTTKP
jgi:hypothetical protein